MNFVRRFLPGIFLLLLASRVSADIQAPQQVLEAFLDAYNAHDVDRVVELMDPSVRTMAVDGDSLSVWSTGIGELEQMLREGFAAVPTTRSEIVESQVLGNYVAVTEKALWDVNGRTRSQCAMSVYKILDGRVHAIWYYPEQACE